jgi:hypothetical protein
VVVSASRNMVAVLEAAGVRGLFDAEVDGWRPTGWGWPANLTRRCSLKRPGGLASHRHGRRSLRTPWPGSRPAVAAGSGRSWVVDRGGQADALAERGADVVVADLEDLVLQGAPVQRDDR